VLFPENKIALKKKETEELILRHEVVIGQVSYDFSLFSGGTVCNVAFSDAGPCQK